MRAKKKYGQHFLVDRSYTEQIAAAAKEFGSGCHNILEVGPGQGALSELLLNDFDNYLAVEIDEDLIDVLSKSMPDIKDKIINQDFLKMDLDQIFENEEFILSGNYPYNISSQIIFKMLQYKDRIPVMLGMFQKEVAERLVSGPGSKVYGVISVLMQLHYHGKVLFDIEPEAFDPVPKVMSSVIVLERHNKFEGKVDEKLYRSVVKSAFNQRRKMLRNTLKPFFVNQAEFLEKELFTKRPEALSIEDFIIIVNKIQKDEFRS